MKISELKLVPKSRRGKFLKNGVKLEPHEEDTANVLTLYGFTVDVIKPVNTPKVHNADFLIDGAIWEVKSPLSSNKKRELGLADLTTRSPSIDSLYQKSFKKAI